MYKELLFQNFTVEHTKGFHVLLFFLSSFSISLLFQPPEMVINQVKAFQKIPVYTISFNYNDELANDFLKELASMTGGKFHSYRFGCKDPIPQEALQVRGP